MIVVTFMARNKVQSKRWQAIAVEVAQRLAGFGSIVFEGRQSNSWVTAYLLEDGSVIEIIKGKFITARHYTCFDAWQIERFVMTDVQNQIADGIYVVEFASDGNDNEAEFEVEGRFVVSNDCISCVGGGLVADLISVGPVTPMTMFRINHSFNNGYYRTRRVRGDDE